MCEVREVHERGLRYIQQDGAVEIKILLSLNIVNMYELVLFFGYFDPMNLSCKLN